jgi:hypothetical protein
LHKIFFSLSTGFLWLKFSLIAAKKPGDGVPVLPGSRNAAMKTEGFSMSKFAIGEKVDNAADDHEVGTVVAVFPTVDPANPSDSEGESGPAGFNRPLVYPAGGIV